MDGKTRNKVNIVLDMIMVLIILPIFMVKGAYHETLGYTLGAVVILHIILHWNQIKVMFRQLVPEPKARVVGVVMFVALVAFVLSLPAVLPNNGMDGRRGGPERYTQDGGGYYDNTGYSETEVMDR